MCRYRSAGCSSVQDAEMGQIHVAPMCLVRMDPQQISMALKLSATLG